MSYHVIAAAAKATVAVLVVVTVVAINCYMLYSQDERSEGI